MNHGFSFGEFELDVGRRLLLKRGEAVGLKPKAFDLLLTLVENRDQTLTKNELLDKVWEDQFVEENNLTVHIAALRKALGETKNENRFIVTVPGKGYRFVAPLNAPADREIVVESHKFERIIVEEEIEEHSGAEDRKLLLPKRYGRVLSFALVGVLLAAAVGVWSYTSRDRAGEEADPRPRDIQPQTIKTRIFPTAGGIPQRVAISPDGRSVAYVQRYKGQDAIWIGDLETNNSIQVTEASDRLHEYMTYGPDGKNIYFTGRDDRNRLWTLMRVSVFGGAVTELIRSVDSAVTFAPDGRHMAFVRHDGSVVTAEAETGASERVLTRIEKPRRLTGFVPSWSPDGSSIAVSTSDETGKGCEVVSVNVSDGSLSEIGHNVCRGGASLAWLPDASSLVLTSSPPDGSNVQIWLVSAANGERRPITSDTSNYQGYSLSVSAGNRVAALQARADPKIFLAETGDAANSRQVLEGSRSRSEGMLGVCFAPDGKIVYIARTGDSRAVWEMNPDGTDQRQLTPLDTGSLDQQVSVTSDNRYLVFESRRSGQDEVWRADRDGLRLVQLTSGGSNGSPAVTTDGKWVIYASRREGGTTLWRVPIEGGDAMRLTAEPGNFPAVSPDGKLLAYSAGQRISIMQVEGGPVISTLEAPSNAVLYNRLRWSPDGRAIVYKDLVQGLWRHELGKEKPAPVAGLEDLRIFHFAFAADGKLVYSGGVPMREIVILDAVQ